MLKIFCFGEILWDVFATHKKIGGAPLNVALRLQSLKNKVSIISSVGKDIEGEELINFIKEHNVNVDFIQINEKYRTGNVKVTLDKFGSATYDIQYPSSWDFIEFNNELVNSIETSDAFIFGSLITRNKVSKETLYHLIKSSKYSIFDVNLRAPHYTKDILIDLLHKSDFVKFNDDELLEISNFLGSRLKSIEKNIEFIAEKTNTSHICVTRGSNGAILYYNKKFYSNSGYSVSVKDTVGAGDSFLATLINFLLKKEPPQKAIDIACAMGALVAKNEGANPKITQEEIFNLMKTSY
jgi:fructokinase